LSALQKAVIVQQLADEARVEEAIHKNASAAAEGKDLYVTFDPDDPEEADLVEVLELYMPGYSREGQVAEMKRRQFLGGLGNE